MVAGSRAGVAAGLNLAPATPRRADMAHRQHGMEKDQLDFFHATLALGRAQGERPLESFVRAAWLERYGTELSLSRYRYFAFDPDHEARRRESMQRVCSSPEFVALIDPRFLLAQNYLHFAEAARRLISDDDARDITGASMLRGRVGDTWEDLPVVFRRIAADAYRIAVDGMLRTTEAAMRLQGLGQDVPAGAALAGAAAVAGSSASVSVHIAKATSLDPTNDGGDPTQISFSPEKVKQLIAQENQPWGETPLRTITYEEHRKRLYACIAKGTLPYPQPDERSVPAKDAVEEARQREMQRGLMLDPDAVREADEYEKRMGLSK